MSQMDNLSTKNITKLKDYKHFPFLIPSIELNILIEDFHVDIKSSMQILPDQDNSLNLILKGKDINLISIFINKKKLSYSEYDLENDKLTLKKIPQNSFILEIFSRIYPHKNTSLEGMYVSDGILLTQCEAEGFRRICFHPDRPDILSKYRVTIEADKAKFPILLSNGNFIDSGEIKEVKANRHIVIWEDPHPKPSYLFALVAGNLKENNSRFITRSGREILIRLHVEPGDEKYTNHAIESLKRAMKWDEDVYGLEYDLDQFNIVAVRHFNMGAMENKSLNIFNSKLILADSATATDEELERIESVVAHEYFHNWTGNRITCRDWFQLSLKEGLTVFRDQCFTADTHSSALKRIEDVSFLRNTQFKEDSGPTAHPVKPSSYLSIDNFYTTTIYEKGAELVRMLQTLLGHLRFRSGFQAYIRKFDGSFATTEDFLNTLTLSSIGTKEDLNFDPDQFSRWYSQAGTPHVSIRREWQPQNEKLIIEFKQKIPDTPGEKNKKPLVIPILTSFLDRNKKSKKEELIVLSKFHEKISFALKDSSENKPIPSFFRTFSAPVVWETDFSEQEYLYLFRFEDDPFSKWEAGQILMRKALLYRLNGEISNSLEDNLIYILKQNIEQEYEYSELLVAKLLSVPGIAELEAYQEEIDPILLFNTRNEFISNLGRKLSDSLKEIISRSKNDLEKEWPLGQSARRNTGIALNLLSRAGDDSAKKYALKNVNNKSMTLARYSLLALHPIECEERAMAMDIFYQRWKDRPVILDSWFSLLASMPSKNALEKVEKLLLHSKFDIKAPNTIRAILGGFSTNIPAFHSLDCSGYEFICDQLIELDSRNPITASRLAKIFIPWEKYTYPYNENMLKAIQRLANNNLSSNTREVVNLINNKIN